MKIDGSDGRRFRTVYVLRETRTETVLGPDGPQAITRDVDVPYTSDPMTLDELAKLHDWLVTLPNLVSEKQVSADGSGL